MIIHCVKCRKKVIRPLSIEYEQNTCLNCLDKIAEEFFKRAEEEEQEFLEKIRKGIR